jgi:hypothetical protein
MVREAAMDGLGKCAEGPVRFGNQPGCLVTELRHTTRCRSLITTTARALGTVIELPKVGAIGRR